MKNIFLLIGCIIIIFTSCSSNNIKTEQVTVTDTQKPKPTELLSDDMLDEDLRENKCEIYRCDYMASTNDSIVRTIIRIEILPDQTGFLHLGVYTCGFSDTEFKIAEDVKRNLNKDQVNGLLELFKSTDFWNIGKYQGKINPSNPPNFIVIDVVKDGEYHRVSRVFSPIDSFNEIRDLAEYFVESCRETKHDLRFRFNQD